MSFQKAYIYRRIVKAKLFIDANYDRSINLDQVAGEAYFSKFHFIRLFKKIYGDTPHQYLIRTRIEKAKELLDGPVSIAEACIAVGFESQGSFTALFKQYVGSTPTAYQSQRRARKLQLSQSPIQFIPNCFSNAFGWNEGR